MGFPVVSQYFQNHLSYRGSQGFWSLSQGTWGTVEDRVHHKQGECLSQGTITCTFIHHGQFRDASQSTIHNFGQTEETGVPGGSPQSTGRTCKQHARRTGLVIEPPAPEA